MATLTVCGIPIDCESIDAEPVAIGDIGRAFGGQAIEAPRLAMSWRIRTVPYIQSTANCIRVLVNGDGHFFDFSAGSQLSTKGNSPGGAGIIPDTVEAGYVNYASGAAWPCKTATGLPWPIEASNNGSYSLHVKLYELQSDGSAQHVVYSHRKDKTKYKNGVIDNTDPAEFRRVSWWNTTLGQSNLGAGTGAALTRNMACTSGTRYSIVRGDGVYFNLLAQTSGTTHATVAPTWTYKYGDTFTDGTVTLKMVNFAYFYLKWFWWFPAVMPDSWLPSLQAAGWPIGNHPTLKLGGDLFPTAKYALGECLESQDEYASSGAPMERLNIVLRELA